MRKVALLAVVVFGLGLVGAPAAVAVPNEAVPVADCPKCPPSW
ncbi:UDP-N-acetyl-D-mannosaminuronate dehydrogenase [Kribbella sandramycini]|uniref:UDP-N-acetyl-D-mannosaminuronate dehydrogenase n=1 Tax=Kribbella sandramycini TaxID=60450 RepID=A0A841SI05_9ACTN|nr:UDP-N-acetyl-D-mannosaminuronate dehydrogenase [Kribbella sandramycini]